MRRLRLSSRALMAAVLMIAVATASLRSTSPLWTPDLFTLTLGIVATSVPA